MLDSWVGAHSGLKTGGHFVKGEIRRRAFALPHCLHFRNPFFLRSRTINSKKDMRKPDRAGFLVLAFAIFALYLVVANWLNFLGLISFPLGSLRTSELIAIVLVEAFVNLYALRIRKSTRPISG